MPGINGNGHVTPVPAENSAAVIIRKIEGLPDDLRTLDPYQLAAFAAFTVLESTERLESLAAGVRATNILDSQTAQKVSSLDAQVVATLDQHAAIREDVAALKSDVASLKVDIDRHTVGILEAIGKAESIKREAMASDADLDARYMMTAAQVLEIRHALADVAKHEATKAARPAAADASKKVAVYGVAATTAGIVAQSLPWAEIFRAIF